MMEYYIISEIMIKLYSPYQKKKNDKIPYRFLYLFNEILR